MSLSDGVWRKESTLDGVCVYVCSVIKNRIFVDLVKMSLSLIASLLLQNVHVSAIVKEDRRRRGCTYI